MKKTLKSYLKLEKRKLNNKLIKGVCTILSCLFFSLCCIPPFQIHADTVIAPTWGSTSLQNQWQSHLTVTNFAENPVNTGTLARLDFDLDFPYYGVIEFDAYVGSNIVYSQYVSITEGHGEYEYRTVSNSPYYITGVKIWSVNLSSAFPWTFPMESYTAVMYAYANLTPYSYLPFFNYNYPMFKVSNGKKIYQSLSTTDELNYYVIFGTTMNVWSVSRLQNIFEFYNCSITEFKVLGRYDSSTPNLTIIKLQVQKPHTDTNSYFSISSIWSSDFGYIPIYIKGNSFDNISLDFALQFELDNRLLNGIEAINEGTPQTEQSASDLNDETTDFQSVASGLYQSENSFNQSMNSNLQQIDTSFNPSTSFGSKFLYSADWVRSQFNTLTSQTPFGSVLSFSMLLGLSLLIIGKVFK